MHEHHEGVNGLPQGMKIYPKTLSMYSYYELLQISHLFDTMYIKKNVVETLWWILDLRSDKEKIVKICNDIHEVSHAMKDVIQSHINGDQININPLPLLLTEQQRNFIK